MKQRLSSLDIRAASNELNARLANKYIQNFYSTKQRYIYMKFSNKDILLVEPGAVLHLTREQDVEISHFCKKLREHCRHARVRRIYQHTFDRIVVMDISRYRIVIELFSGGNILIIDDEDVIIDLLRPVPDLGIVKTTKYLWNNVNLVLTFDRFVEDGLEKILPFDSEFIETVKTELEEQIGPLETLKGEGHRDRVTEYFNGLTERIESLMGFGEVVLKNGRPEQLFAFSTTSAAVELRHPQPSAKSPEQPPEQSPDNVEYSLANRISDALSLSETAGSDMPAANDTDRGSQTAYQIILWDKSHIEDIIKSNKKCSVLHFPTINEAIEYSFSDRRKAQKVKLGKEERIEQAQRAYIEQLKIQANSFEQIANTMEENRDFISEILDIFKSVYEQQIDWNIFEDFWKEEKANGNRHSQAITEFDMKNRTAILAVEGAFFKVDTSQSVNSNIKECYQKRKKVLDKLVKTKQAMERKPAAAGGAARNKPSKASAKAAATTAAAAPGAVSAKLQSRIPYWFEKYNFFFSSDEGALVIGGKNAQDNEILVKTHMDKGDLYFHCDIHGASSVVSKSRTEAAIREAAQMALCFSKCWDQSILSRVFYVEPAQVSKTAPTGEYLGKGGFLITGKKEFISIYRLEYGIGLLFKVKGSAPLQFAYDDSGLAGELLHSMPVSAPWSVIQHYKYRVRICPGSEKKTQLANTVLRTFNGQAAGTAEELCVRAISVDEYMRVIPGKSRLAKVK